MNKKINDEDKLYWIKNVESTYDESKPNFLYFFSGVVVIGAIISILVFFVKKVIEFSIIKDTLISFCFAVLVVVLLIIIAKIWHNIELKKYKKRWFKNERIKYSSK